MSGVICTGHQKAGTHLLWKVVQLLGIPKHPDQYQEGKGRFSVSWLNDGYSVHRHLPYDGKELILEKAPNTKFAVIIRHPKNIIISRARRMQHIKRNTKTIAEILDTHLNLVEEGGRPLLDPKRQLWWTGWMSDPDVCVVRFEEIRSDDKAQTVATMRKLSGYLNLRHTDYELRKLIPSIPGDGTWTGKNSDWHDFWDDKIDKRFSELGGYDVMERLGYES